MTSSERPATESAIMERLMALEAKLDTIAEEARRHWEQDQERMRLVDAFMDPQLNLEATLKQTIDALERTHKAVQALSRAVHDEHVATRAAVATHLQELESD